MGNARDYLESLTGGGGFEYRLVLAFEGIGILVTNGDPAKALTAWSGDDRTQAVGGLVIGEWGKGQSMRPWSDKLSIPGMIVGIQPDPTDAIGILAFNTSGGVETKLTAELDPDDTSVSVKRTDDFVSEIGSEGEIHIGTECLYYSAVPDTNTFTISQRGRYSLFGEDFGRPHPFGSYEHYVTTKPPVTSLPRVWAGRGWGLWMHRVTRDSSGEVWDVKAEAQLIGAGRIVGDPRDDELGWTWFDLEDVRGAIRDTMLLRNQYRCEMRDGIWLHAGMKFYASTLLGDGTGLTANVLEVIESGASGAYEIDEGYYSYDEVLDFLNTWLDQAYNDAALSFPASLGLVETTQGLRTQVAFTPPATFDRLALSFPINVFKFLGWPDSDGTERWEETSLSPAVPKRSFFDTSTGIDFNNPPLIPVTNESGRFEDNTPGLPSELGVTVTETDVGVFLIEGSGFMIARKTTDGGGDPALQPIGYLPHQPFVQLLGSLVDVEGTGLLNADQGTVGAVNIKQVYILAGRFHQLVQWFLFSTGVSTYNGERDQLPRQLGAGVPVQLFGDTFEDDLLALEAGSADLLVLIDKPTKLWDVLAPEFVLRAANLVWKGNGGLDGNGGIRVMRWSTPTSQTAVHNFTEADKAEPASLAGGRRGSHRTPTLDDDAFVTNIVEIRHNRLLKGNSNENYNGTITIADVANMEEQGQRSTAIKARNTFAALEWGDGNINELASEIAAWMPLFGRPLRYLRRSISLPRFLNVAPGDHCTVTDYFVRNPATGKRKGQDGDAGLVGYPGLVVGARVDWGGFQRGGKPRPPMGEVEIVIFPRNRYAPYSPCAQVDDTAGGGGYNAGTKTITCYAHKHSASSQAADAAQFVTNDQVLIVEMDPANPASPLSWERGVASQTGNTIVHDGVALAGFDSTKKYRVISLGYFDAQATQRTDCYQADDADGLIEDLAQAYEFGFHSSGHNFTADDPSVVQVALYADIAFGDGKPYDTGYEKDICQLINNLVNYRTAPSVPCMFTSPTTQTGACVRAIKRIIPITMQPGDLGRGDRYLWVKPWYRSATGASVTVRMTLCRSRPTGTSLVLTSTTAPEYTLGAGPRQANNWTTSSTTWQHGPAYPFHFKNLDANGQGYLIIETTQNAECRGYTKARAGLYTKAA